MYSRQSDIAESAVGVQKMFCSSICPMEYRLGTDKAPWGISYFGGVDLEGISVFLNEGFGNRTVVRSRRHILDDSNNDFILSIPLVEASALSQFGNVTHCAPGNFRILATSVPFWASVSPSGATTKYAELLAKISASLLRQLLPSIDDFSNVVAALRPGPGQLMKSLLQLSLTEGRTLPAGQQRDLGRFLIQSIVNAVQEASEFSGALIRPHISSHARIRERAKDYILRNLANPDLDRKLVAAHCQVSERYLNAAFAADSSTSCGFIREARLQQCRAALLNPALHHRPIVEIAANWGFGDASSFNRTYKARFGVTPGEDRSTAR